MIRVRWVSSWRDREYVIADGPVMFGGDEHDTIPVTVTLPNGFGGKVRSDVLMSPGGTFTISFTLEPDPE